MADPPKQAEASKSDATATEMAARSLDAMGEDCMWDATEPWEACSVAETAVKAAAPVPKAAGLAAGRVAGLIAGPVGRPAELCAGRKDRLAAGEL